MDRHRTGRNDGIPSYVSRVWQGEADGSLVTDHARSSRLPAAGDGVRHSARRPDRPRTIPDGRHGHPEELRLATARYLLQRVYRRRWQTNARPFGYRVLYDQLG